ncbi:hypothetical protein [Hoeflea sp.]|uniref:hypothetical protein n=1 Tax=Hoeflea sp. TaxID=1940281 RepID=UPI003B52B1FC
MSIMSVVNRFLLKRIISGRTWAEAKVYEQPLDPIMDVLKEGMESKTPVIAVYTQEASNDEPFGVAEQFGVNSLVCMIYIYLPPKVTVTEGATEIEIDNSGAGLALDVVSRQIFASLHSGNEDWIAIWRKLIIQIDKIKRSFVLHEIENGTNIPVMEIRLDLSTVAEPSYGEALYGGWLMLDTKLRATGDPEHLQFANLLKGMIEAPADLEPLELVQMQHNLTDAGAKASGFDYSR